MLILRYIGHATVLLDLDGVRVLTDPLLRQRVAHLRRADRPAGLPADVDAVLLSHAHHDHLDRPSLRLARPRLVVAPHELVSLLGEFEVTGVAEDDELRVGPLTVRATHAEHEGGRPPFRREGTTLGYAILGSKRVFFAGDTDLFDGMESLVDDLDVALVPIWGWGPSLGRGKHLDPVRAAEAVRRLAPRIAVPIHWGTYRPFHRGAAARFLSEPARAFAEAAALAAPDVEIRVLQPGEELQLD